MSPDCRKHDSRKKTTPPGTTHESAREARPATSASPRYISSQLEKSTSTEPAGSSSSVASPTANLAFLRWPLTRSFSAMRLGIKSIASTERAPHSPSAARAPVKRPMPAPSSTTRDPAMGPRRERTCFWISVREKRYERGERDEV